jgi:hypothetical protein
MSDTDEDTVVLHAEVDVSDATDEQRAMYEDMADLFAERFDLFVYKNLDYGSSFLSAGRVDQALSGEHDGPFGDARTANLYKLFTRIQDKDQRFYQQAFCGGQDHVNESASETAGDAAVYWFMVEWLLRYNDE